MFNQCFPGQRKVILNAAVKLCEWKRPAPLSLSLCVFFQSSSSLFIPTPTSCDGIRGWRGHTHPTLFYSWNSTVGPLLWGGGTHTHTACHSPFTHAHHVHTHWHSVSPSLLVNASVRTRNPWPPHCTPSPSLPCLPADADQVWFAIDSQCLLHFLWFGEVGVVCKQKHNSM